LPRLKGAATLVTAALLAWSVYASAGTLLVDLIVYFQRYASTLGPASILGPGLEASMGLVAGLLALLALLRPGVTLLLPLLYLVDVTLTGSLYLRVLITLVVAVLVSPLYAHLAGGTRFRLRINSWKPLLAGVAALIVAVASYTLILAESGRMVRTLYRLAPKYTAGDVKTFISMLSPTAAFKLVLAGFAFYIVWKAVDSIGWIGLLALSRQPALAEYEARRLAREWTSRLALFQGRQNALLRESQFLLYSFLFSPALFPLVREAVLQFIPGLNTFWTAVYITVSYILGWLITRLVVSALFDPPSIKRLLKPRSPAAYLILGLLGGVTVAMLEYLAGGDPVAVVLSALTGRPFQADPIASLINIGSLSKSVPEFLDVIVKGADAVVKTLWGG